MGQVLKWASISDAARPPIRGRAEFEKPLAGPFPADRHCLEQVLLNFVINAVTAVPAEAAET